MDTISQSDIDKFVSHTIRIELKDGFVLIYRVSLEAKSAFRKLILEDMISEYENGFLWILIPHDRLALINKKDIIRITFCFDPPSGAELQYFDNFNIFDKPEEGAQIDIKEELYLPQLIIMHNRHMEDTEIVEGVTTKTEGYFGNISFYSSLSIGDIEGFEFDYLEDEEELVLLSYKYLQFIDDDGEENFMPLDNLTLIEIERPLIMSDELLNLYLK